MTPDTFESLVAAAWDAMPERFKEKVVNVALLVEEEPSEELRKEEHLGPGDTLLGIYHGINRLERGELYGIGGTLPDTITLFRLPLLAEAEHLLHIRGDLDTFEDALTEAVRETLWHEVGHYFGLSEHEIDEREGEGTNRFKEPGPV
jgi:predicted Zn-dependent protease with MMP-like domain